MADDRDDVEREHTTMVETGGGGGGGVLAVVLLIIVVLVLLYVFRGQLGPRLHSASFRARSTSTSTTADREGTRRTGCESPSAARARFPTEPRPFACAALSAVTGAPWLTRSAT